MADNRTGRGRAEDRADGPGGATGGVPWPAVAGPREPEPAEAAPRGSGYGGLGPGGSRLGTESPGAETQGDARHAGARLHEAGSGEAGFREVGPGEAGPGEAAGEAGTGDVAPDADTGRNHGLRKVARVILLDPADRILLLHGYEPDDPSMTWWFTPGGGLEPGEDREQAARRELAEEAGITDVDLGPVLWRRTCSFPFDGRRWDQDEWYYLGRTRQTRTRTEGQTELERRSVAGLRWWSADELLATRETVYPTRLAQLLRTLLDEGPPEAPVVLETERV